MPIIRFGEKLIYFAHIPKCAGTTIEQGLKKSGIEIAFLDEKWGRTKKKYGWSLTSPQHISTPIFNSLFPPSFFDSKFAVTRHPLSRFISAFRYNIQNGKIPKSVPYSELLSDFMKNSDFQVSKFDNHFTPASQLVPNDCELFKLERGLSKVSRYLNDQLPNLPEMITFGHENRSNDIKVRENVKKSPAETKLIGDISISDELIDQVYQLYKTDYDLFGYEKNEF